MNAKRILSVLITACMLLSLVPTFTAVAAETVEWEYTVGVGKCQFDSAECKKANAITVKLKFTDNSEETGFLKNTETRDRPATAVFKTSRAPWTVNGVELTNSTKDSLWMYTIWIKVKRVGSSAASEYILLHYPGTPNNLQSGVPIDQDNGGPDSYSVPFEAKRKILGTDDFMSSLNKTHNLSPLNESGTITAAWSGKIKCSYISFFDSAAHDCMNLSAPPEIKVTASGKKADGGNVSLPISGITIPDNKMGYTVDRAALAAYMNKNNMSQIQLKFTLTFPSSSTEGNNVYTATTTFRRKAFCVEDVSYSRNLFTLDSNNKYYNYNSGSKITATVKIKTTDQFSVYANQFHKKNITFGEAYLTAGDGIKIPANETSATTYSLNLFDLSFNLPDGVDSGAAGLTLVIKDAYLDVSGTKFLLWNSVKNGKDMSHYTSTHKIDRKEPTYTIVPAEGVDLSKWNKVVELYVTSSEKTCAFFDGKALEGYASMYLYGGGKYPVYYKYDDTTQSDYSAAASFQKLPTAKDFTQKVTLSLRDRLEGEYKLYFYGCDEARNYYTFSYPGIKLDNKAPTVTVTETQSARLADESIGNTYDVKISDASGTARLYYMFTEKFRSDAPAFDETSASKTSGDMDTTLDRWAFIEQADTENGNTAAAYLRVEKGDYFSGRMLYFGVDEAGNKTTVYEKPITIRNENTSYRITPTDVDKPLRSYTITIDTNKNNTVYYCWKNAESNSYLSGYKVYKDAIDTSKDDATKNLHGVYTLEYKIVPPSGTNPLYGSTNYVFDNKGPEISITSATAASGKEIQTLSVYAADTADVVSATAKVVTPSGADVAGCEEFDLNIEDGTLRQNISVMSVPSGSYALRVSATDSNGNESSSLSDVFLIRNKAPEGSVTVKSSITHSERPLVTSENIELEFDISESFADASYAKNQALYYRIGISPEEYGEWIKACDAVTADGAITASTTSAPQRIALADGENTLYVQTAIYGVNDSLTEISMNTVKTDEVIFYYDETAPEAELYINDVLTNESIEGTLYVSDNLGGEITISCESDAVSIGEIENGEVTVTVSESVETYITVSDASGNEKKVGLKIYGIDKTPPTADIIVSTVPHGERQDAAATVKICGVAGDTVRFALIPTDEYTGGNIPEEYFAPDPTFFKTSVTRTDPAEWDGENDITYKVEILGTTGEWYLGVHSADTLGNEGDVVFTDDVLSAEDVALTQDTTPRLTSTEYKTLVDTSYNVPVYTLSQEKILGADSEAVLNNTFDIADFDTLSTEEKVEAVNLALAKQQAMSYSDSYSFAASQNGDYDLYTVDDLGRAVHLIATVEGVEFGAASEIKVTKYKEVLDETAESFVGVEVPDGEYVCVMGDSSYIIVESADPTDTDTLFMNIELEDRANGLTFNEGESEECYDESNNFLGYSKMRYDIGQMYLDDTGYYPEPSDKTDRLLTVKAFTKGSDYNNSDEYSEKTSIISYIDNTEPTVTWSSDPHVIDYAIEGSGDGLYEVIVYHPTPGNVTFTFTAQDKETGIVGISPLTDYCCGEVWIPESGLSSGYWVWDGNEHTQSYEVWDETEGAYIQKEEPIPVIIEYFGDGDIYGVKALKYTFTEPFRLESMPVFINSHDAVGMPTDSAFDGVISTEDIIYKIPIEENEDFYVDYYYEDAEGNWVEILDPENTYYKNAKAVIDIPDDSRGFERGLYVSNNSKNNEKLLNKSQNEFTFKLRDKYGYTLDVPVSLKNFDTTPGTISYTLAESAKTNKPYNVTIDVADGESGIGKVILTVGDDETVLTEDGETAGRYIGEISKNGTYGITLYDKVGNKTAKSFTVKNIDSTVPTASVVYSTKEYTSRPVSATLYFSEPNVKITGIEPLAPFTTKDFSVSYTTSTITFIKSGTLDVYFEDDYGNEGVESVAVGNIDKTPPALTAVKNLTQDLKSVSVSFEKIDILTSEMDLARKESEIYVTYGGITRAVADEDGNKSSFLFHSNGNYTFRVHDKEGLSSFVTVEITDIDTTAPVITSVSWSYDYDEFDEATGTWVTKSTTGTKTPVDGTAGYVIANDIYDITNNDVTVKVETDSDTRLVGSSDDYTPTKEKVYGENGLFIFNTEKANGLVDSYGVDIEIIDKTPPVIDLLGTSELVFYENPKMNSEYDISMVKYVDGGKYTAYNAYDVFNGKKTDLTSKVEIDWGGFDPDNLANNTFDSSKPYTITYRVSDSAHNIFETKRTIRLVGIYDTIALVNGELPDFAGRISVKADKLNISLMNFSGTAYVRYTSGLYTMGQMKKLGTMLKQNESGEFETPSLPEGWYTFYIQTDKRDYFTLNVHLSK